MGVCYVKPWGVEGVSAADFRSIVMLVFCGRLRRLLVFRSLLGVPRSSEALGVRVETLPLSSDCRKFWVTGRPAPMCDHCVQTRWGCGVPEGWGS